VIALVESITAEVDPPASWQILVPAANPDRLRMRSGQPALFGAPAQLATKTPTSVGFATRRVARRAGVLTGSGDGLLIDACDDASPPLSSPRGV
jgi:hypothetical protein